ncbi:hypothetical protein A4D02_05070 [Niastella koreensis]|uniref:Uncharacterized protein n=2 Tax=Niastella koreensis TaxID=354356 RepID=G8T7V1_NIAKG|nr:hypothetical protein Niako_7178 [Niastella koreensis GR20-10]OQP55675.1 hypothetical protein A4D02_05070 [Niastella koreensis]
MQYFEVTMTHLGLTLWDKLQTRGCGANFTAQVANIVRLLLNIGAKVEQLQQKISSKCVIVGNLRVKVRK